MVLWFIGISGAGKSTLANMLKLRFEKEGKPLYIMDGDVIRNFYDNDLGFSEQDRRANIKRILLAAYVLDANGVNIAVANISPFEDLRAFARKKIPGYIEVYLKKDLSNSMKADVKGVYKKNLNQTALVGKEIAFDEPLNSDLVIETDKISEEESLEKVLELLKERGQK